MQMKLRDRYAGFREKTRGMKFKEFILYVKDYYLGDFLLFAFITGVIAAAVITAVININTDNIIHGVGVNITLSDEGEKYIKDDFLALHKTWGRQKVDYSNVIIADTYSKAEEISGSYYASESVVAQVGAKRLDYLILNELGFYHFATQEIYMDLRDMFSEEELAALGDRVVYTQEDESEEMLPMGIDITDTEFIKHNSVFKEKTFIAFAGNAPHKELAKEFFYYLMDYK